MNADFGPGEIYEKYHHINELLHRSAVTSVPLDLPLIQVKLIRMGFIAIYPNRTVKWHEHPYFEAFSILQGNVLYRIDEGASAFNNRDGFFCVTPPMMSHTLQFGEEKSIVFSLTFDCSVRAPGGEPLLRLLPSLLLERKNVLKPSERLWNLYDMLTSPEQSERGCVVLTAQYSRLFLSEFLYEILPEMFADEIPGRYRRHYDFEHDRINAIKAFIDHDINVIGCLPIEREFGMSKRHLNRIFKAATGKSIGQYRIARKLQVAKHLLRGSNNSISGIGESLRFRSLSQFSTFFRKHCNCSPYEFRLNASENLEHEEMKDTAP